MKVHPKRPAIFLDRDGVINKNSTAYVKTWDEFQFLPGFCSSICVLRGMPYLIVVVTNQSAIGRGLTTRSAVADIHSRMKVAVENMGGRIDAVYFCPHTPEDRCICRKPLPGMILRAAEDLSIDVSRSLIVGDKTSDVEAGRRAGCRTVLLYDKVEDSLGAPAADLATRSWADVLKFLETFHTDVSGGLC